MQKTLEAPRLDQTKASAPQPKNATNKALSWGRFSLEFFVMLAAGLLAVEALCNFGGVGNEEFLEPDPVLGIRHIAGKKVVWRLEGFSAENISSQGLRDREHALTKAPNTYRIALLGDSATEGMQVSMDKTYASQLEKILNSSSSKNKTVEVLNFGCSSYSNGQEMLQLEQQIAPFKPDLVVLMYNRGDYIENIRDPSTLKAEPRPYFYLAADGVLTQDNTIMDFNKDGFRPNPTLDFLRRHSRIYGILTHTNLALSLNEMLYSKLRNSIMKMLPGSRTNWKHIEAPYTITDPWKVSAAIFNRVNADCKAMDARLMLVCFPNIVNDTAYADQIRALEKQAKDQNFIYSDLSANYMHSADPKKLFLKYHFSDEGHKVAAEQIAATISRQIKY